MAYQTTPIDTFDPASPGQVADSNPAEYNSEDAFCEDTSIGFGIVVSRGTADDEVTKGGDGTSLGVTVKVNKETESDLTTVQYNQYEAVTYLISGNIWVTLNNAGNAGDNLYYNDTTGAIYAGTASTGQTQFPTGCKLLTDTASGAVGKIRITNMVV